MSGIKWTIASFRQAARAVGEARRCRRRPGGARAVPMRVSPLGDAGTAQGRALVRAEVMIPQRLQNSPAVGNTRGDVAWIGESRDPRLSRDDRRPAISRFRAEPRPIPCVREHSSQRHQPSSIGG